MRNLQISKHINSKWNTSDMLVSLFAGIAIGITVGILLMAIIDPSANIKGSFTLG